jgi:hypothetical protein
MKEEEEAPIKVASDARANEKMNDGVQVSQKNPENQEIS